MFFLISIVKEYDPVGGRPAKTRKKFSRPWTCRKKALIRGSPSFTTGALKKKDNKESTVGQEDDPASKLSSDLIRTLENRSENSTVSSITGTASKESSHVL